MARTVCRFYKKNSEQTPLHFAAKIGQLEIVTNAYADKAIEDKNPTDVEEWTPLHYAAQSGHVTMCQLIIDQLEDKNPKSRFGLTPLHLAVLNNHFPCCKLLIENAEDKNPPQPLSLWTPLHAAAENGNFQICQLLLQHVTDKNPSDRFGSTPLFLADQHGHQSIYDLIRNSMPVPPPEKRRRYA